MNSNDINRAASVDALDYQILFDIYPDAVLILGSTGQILHANLATLQNYGYNIESLKQMSLADLVSPDFRTNVSSHIQQAIISNNQFEIQLRCNDACDLPVEVFTRPITYSDQQAIVAIVHDISQRKQERKLSACVEQSGEAILITNSDYHVEYINPAFTKMTGYHPDEIIGKNPNILNSGKQDVDFYRKMWHTIIKKKTTWQGKMINKRKDGSFYPTLLSITPIHDQSGNTSEFTHYVGIWSDLSQFEDKKYMGWAETFASWQD